MHRRALLATVAVALAGCSGDDGSENGSENGNESDGTTDTPVSDIVLSEEDLPNEFALQDRTPRTESDVFDEAVELGWQEGYRVEFARSDGNVEVSNTVSRYPPGNIPDIWELDFQDRLLSEIDGSLESLPDPEIGTRSEAYRLELADSDVVGYIIRFTRADIFQRVQLFGVSGADYEFAAELARRAAGRVD